LNKKLKRIAKKAEFKKTLDKMQGNFSKKIKWFGVNKIVDPTLTLNAQSTLNFFQSTNRRAKRTQLKEYASEIREIQKLNKLQKEHKKEEAEYRRRVGRVKKQWKSQNLKKRSGGRSANLILKEASSLKRQINTLLKVLTPKTLNSHRGFKKEEKSKKEDISCSSLGLLRWSTKNIANDHSLVKGIYLPGFLRKPRQKKKKR
jgi:hypothetical protein